MEQATLIADAIRRIKEAIPMADAFPRFVAAVIRQALSLLKSNRAVSLDNQVGYDLKELPRRPLTTSPWCSTR